jgi:hypothetical protein
MTYFVAGAIVLSSAYSASEARKSRKQAENDQRTMLAQQASDQADRKSTRLNSSHP